MANGRVQLLTVPIQWSQHIPGVPAGSVRPVCTTVPCTESNQWLFYCVIAVLYAMCCQKVPNTFCNAHNPVTVARAAIFLLSTRGTVRQSGLFSFAANLAVVLSQLTSMEHRIPEVSNTFCFARGAICGGGWQALTGCNIKRCFVDGEYLDIRC